jgi:hypothetical protein
MSQITLNTIQGISPYTVFVCESTMNNCIMVLSGVTNVPPSVTFTIPSGLTSSPSVIIKIVDYSGCVFYSSYSCITPTPTPTLTPTLSITPSITPTVTPTPTNYTPNPTPTVTSTITPTPSITPTNQLIYYEGPIYVLVESENISDEVGQWAVDNGSKFYGFTNGSSLSEDQNEFEQQMNVYMNFSGWTKVYSKPPYFVASILTFFGQGLGYTNPLLDSFGNKKVDNTFQTISIPLSTVSYKAWYTILVDSTIYNGYKTTEIGVGLDIPNQFNVFSPDQVVTSKTFTYTGENYTKSTYYVYTTYPNEVLYLDNSKYTIYFKGISTEQ